MLERLSRKEGLDEGKRGQERRGDEGSEGRRGVIEETYLSTVFRVRPRTRVQRKENEEEARLREEEENGEVEEDGK